jgi:transcriptional regulator, araC family
MSKIDEICKYLDAKFSSDGKIQSDIKELFVYRASVPTEFLTGVYEPALCMVFKGSKLAKVGNDFYEYDEQRYLLAATHIPAVAKIKGCPYLAIKINFELEDILGVIESIGGAESKKGEFAGLALGAVDDELLEAVFKFIRLLERPNDAKFLAKLAIKEILYILLKGENGDFLRQYVMLETIENRVTRAAKEIKSNYTEAINIENLAKKLGISASSLYHNFKRITALSPLQFQKKIRLEEAKNSY